MTISSTTRIAGPFTGNGTASTFPFTFKVFAAADLDVVRLNSSTGVESTLVLNSDYSVTLNGDQNSNPGGSITLLAGALATGFTLTITSDIANLQPTDLTNQGGFYPEVITDSFDRSTIQIQQMSQDVGRSLKAPLSDGTPNMEMPVAASRANKYLVFDANGLPSVSAGSGTDTALRTDLANATVAAAGAGLVGFRAVDAASTARTVLERMRETISVKDFGAVGNGVADDTAAIQAAIDYCVINKTSLYIPRGTYAINTLTIDFGGASLAMPKQIGFKIYGDGGGKEAFTGSSGNDGTVLRYSGNSGYAITFAGRQSSCMRIEGIAIYGTALQANGTGSTAIGLNLVGAINHSLRDVVITGFAIGLYAEYSYIGSHFNCRFTQNKVNCKLASAMNTLVVEQCDYTAGISETLVIETNTAQTSRCLTFIGCLFESAVTAIRINPATAGIFAVRFITPYMENGAAPALPKLLVCGYDSAGIANTTSNVLQDLTISELSYSGVSPGTMFTLNNCDSVVFENMNVQFSSDSFSVTSTVSDVRVNGHKLFGGSFSLPIISGAYKQGLQRSANHNLLAGGNYLVASGSYEVAGGLTSTRSYVNGEPIVEFTVPPSTPAYATITWHVENLANLAGQYVQILVALQRGQTTLDITADMYDSTNTAWTGTLMSGWSTTVMDYRGRTIRVPTSNLTRNYLQIRTYNNLLTPQTFKVKGVYLLTRNSGPVVTDGVDVLSALSGTASCTPTATVAVPFTNAADYRVIVTPSTAGVTASVTKSATSFLITCSGNSSADYVVIPRVRVLQ